MLITVRVKPGSRKGPLVEPVAPGLERPEQLTVFVRERAVDGKANEAVVAVLAEHFEVPRGRVDLVRGHTSRIKTFRVDDQESSN